MSNEKHILFLCVANSARSQMAEGLARHLLPSNVRVSSAGSNPGTLNPLSIAVLAEQGIDISKHFSKSVSDIEASSVDVVITLCAEEICPVFSRNVEKLHWALPDPASATGSDEDKLNSFREVRDELLRRIEMLSKNLAKPI